MSDDLKVWNVKDFPALIRTRITNAAAKQGVTVAEWLTAYFQLHGIGDEPLPVIQPRSNPDYRGSAADLALLLQASGLQGEHLPRAVRSYITELARHARRDISRPAEPRIPVVGRTRRDMLPAPNGAAEDAGP